MLLKKPQNESSGISFNDDTFEMQIRQQLKNQRIDVLSQLEIDERMVWREYSCVCATHIWSQFSALQNFNAITLKFPVQRQLSN